MNCNVYFRIIFFVGQLNKLKINMKICLFIVLVNNRIVMLYYDTT